METDLVLDRGQLVPCATIWSEAVHVVAASGSIGDYYITYALTPHSSDLAQDHVYSSHPGETWVKELEDSEYVFYEYLGVLRLVAEMRDPETGDVSYLLATPESSRP